MDNDQYAFLKALQRIADALERQADATERMAEGYEGIQEATMPDLPDLDAVCPHDGQRHSMVLGQQGCVKCGYSPKGELDADGCSCASLGVDIVDLDIYCPIHGNPGPRTVTVDG